MDFKLENKRDKELILYPIGELDIYASEDFKKRTIELYNEEKSNITIDSKDLEYLDSTGLGAFIHLYRELEKDGFKIRIINLKESIKKLFTITKLDEMFEIK